MVVYAEVGEPVCLHGRAASFLCSAVCVDAHRARYAGPGEVGVDVVGGGRVAVGGHFAFCAVGDVGVGRVLGWTVGEERRVRGRDVLRWSGDENCRRCRRGGGGGRCGGSRRGWGRRRGFLGGRWGECAEGDKGRTGEAIGTPYVIDVAIL